MNASDRDGLTRPPRPGIVLAVLAFSGMCASFMQTILIPIQGQLPQLLSATPDDTAWAVTITLLVSAAATPISGRLGDMFGKRRLAMVCLSMIVVGSVIAAFATSVGVLVAGRGLQGVGMGVIPLGISILRDVMPPARLGTAIALMSATLGVGSSLGLPISAVITTSFDWHLLFWISAALGALAFVLVWRIVPVSTLRTGGRFDLIGALGLTAGLVAILVALSRGNQWGWSSAPVLSLLIGGVGVLLIWGVYETRRPGPLVDLRVSARAPVLLTNAASIAMGFALFASSIAFPQILELPPALGGVGLSLLHASLVLMPSGLTMLAMAPIAGRLQRRLGPRALLVGGAGVLALAYLLAASVDLTAGLVLAINALIGGGVGLGYAAMPTLIMRAVPASETGAANSLNTLMRSLGTAVASATVAAILAQSATVVDGIARPDLDGFRTAFLLGFAAALLCGVIAAFIPKPAHTTGEHEALR